MVGWLVCFVGATDLVRFQIGLYRLTLFVLLFLFVSGLVPYYLILFFVFKAVMALGFFVLNVDKCCVASYIVLVSLVLFGLVS